MLISQYDKVALNEALERTLCQTQVKYKELTFEVWVMDNPENDIIQVEINGIKIEKKRKELKNLIDKEKNEK